MILGNLMKALGVLVALVVGAHLIALDLAIQEPNQPSVKVFYQNHP